MACDLSKGLSGAECLNNIAGLRNLYIANYDEYNFELTGDDETGLIIDELPTKLTEVFKFPLFNDGNSFSEEVEKNRPGSTAVWNQTLEFVIGSPDARKQFQIKNLVWGRPIIFVEDNMGEVFIVGMEFGAEVGNTTSIEGERGGARQYQLTAEAVELNPISYLSETAIDDLKALVHID